ncbi:MAG: hypothetical protein GTO14_09360 [Anaerolineales bacterium]|nr:hypothetical protein [Anaerolineales bacterium]
MNLKRWSWLLFAPPLLVIFLGLIYAAIPKVGYCFDNEFDESGERLYVTAGKKGGHVFKISPSASLVLVDTYFESGYYRYIEMVGNKAYIANGDRGLEVLDISEDSPKPVWAQHGSKGYGIDIVGDIAYLASNELGLQIFDITNPHAPVLTGAFETGGRAWDVWVKETYAYMVDRDLGLVVFDISAPSQPTVVSSLSWVEDPMAEMIDGASEFVYIASGENGLIVIDVSDPWKPVTTFEYDSGPDSWREGVNLRGSTLYLTMDDSLSREENGLHIFDLLDPSSPRLLSKFPITDGVEDISVAGSHLALSNTLSGIVLLDVHDPTKVILIDTHPSLFWRFFTKFLG